MTQHQIKPDEESSAKTKGYQINQWNIINVGISQPTCTEKTQSKIVVFSKRLQISKPGSVNPSKQKRTESRTAESPTGTQRAKRIKRINDKRVKNQSFEVKVRSGSNRPSFMPPQMRIRLRRRVTRTRKPNTPIRTRRDTTKIRL